MSMNINQSLAAMQAYYNLNSSTSALEKSIAKISSGRRITTAADDAAGLCISSKLQTQINGLARVKLNVQDGISMIQTAEGGLSNTQSILQRIRELANQSANGTHTSSDRLAMQSEVKELLKQINEIAGSTTFNTKKLLNGNQSALVSSSSKSATGIVSAGSHASGDYNVSLKTVKAGISQVQRSGMLTDRKTGLAATGSTKLEDIAEFYDEDGVFALNDSATLNLTGNGNSSEVRLDSKMSLNEFAMNLQQSATAESNGLNIKGTTASVVQDPNGGTYLEVVSGAVGSLGSFSIMGSEALNTALGFSNTREAVDSYVQATVTEANGNTRTVMTSSDRANGLIEGVSVKFNSQAAQVSGIGGVTEGLKFESSENIGLSLNGNNLNINIASGNWSMEGLARNINEQIANDANFANSGIKATVVEGQIHLGYDSTAVNPQDFQITTGSDTLGLATGTYGYTAMGNKDKKASIQGFSAYRDDVASKNINFKVNGASVNAFSTIINKTQADFIEAKDFEQQINTQLSTANSDVRFDIVNGSMAFTTNNLGKNTQTNAQSVVNISIEDASTGTADTDTISQFGFRNMTATGSGDTNFRLHISDTAPQLQIGPNQGQTMNISMGDMSVEALGIGEIDLTTIYGANKALSKLAKAMDMVVSETSRMGMYQNRLGYTMSNLQTMETNLTSAESRIGDVDIAAEIMEYMRNQIKSQASQAMLAQANSAMGNVLSLLGG